jgi:outer membrane receptor protein involved in Fe transport
VPLASFEGTDYDQWSRQTAAFDGNLFATAIGQHALKGGVQYEKIKNKVSRGEAANLFAIRWGLSDAFGAGVRGTYGSLQVRRFRTEGGAESTNLGFYLQDAWQIRPNLILNAGVRTDRERVPNYGRKRDPTLPEWAIEFGYGKKIAPRLGLAWDVLTNQKLKLYGSYGTYYDITKLQAPRSAFGGEKWIAFLYPLNTLDWETLPNGCHISTNDPTDNPCPSLGTPVALDLRYPTDPREGIDPDLHPMEQREFQLGGEFQLTPQSIVSLRYVNKRLINAIEDIGFLVEIAPGQFAESYIQGNPGKGIVAGDPPGPVPAQPTAKRNYDAIELTVDRLFNKQWSLRATYTYSRLVGNYSGLASSDEFGRAEPNIERYFDALHNAFDQNGREVVDLLNTDRPHAVEAQALYRTPWGTTAGVNSSWRSGTPVSEEVSYIGVPFFPHGRANKGRTPNLRQTDLLLMHPLHISRYRFELSLNVLNLFDEKAVTRIGNRHYRADLCDVLQCNRGAAQEDFFSRVPIDVDQLMAGQPVDPYYLKPLAWQSPRAVRVGVKFLF